MGYNIRKLEITRAPFVGYKNPYRRNSHGIYHEGLEKYQRRLLLENPIIRNRAICDSFMYAIFAYMIPQNIGGSKSKLYWDKTTESFVTMEKLHENYNTIEWTCALSNKPIMSSIDNFDLENFVHTDYHDALDAPMVDSRILKSSVDFRKHIKKLLLNQQKEFIKYARKNSKL